MVVHLAETLDADSLRQLEDTVRQDAGVVSVGHVQDNAHMIMVVYDSDTTRAASLLHTFQECGLHAQSVLDWADNYLETE